MVKRRGSLHTKHFCIVCFSILRAVEMCRYPERNNPPRPRLSPSPLPRSALSFSRIYCWWRGGRDGAVCVRGCHNSEVVTVVVAAVAAVAITIASAQSARRPVFISAPNMCLGDG